MLSNPIDWVLLAGLVVLARVAWVDEQMRRARRTLVDRGVLKPPPQHPMCRCGIVHEKHAVYLRGGILDGEEADWVEHNPPLLTLWHQGRGPFTYYRHDVAGFDDTKADGRPVYYAENLVKEDPPWTDTCDL